MSNTTENIEKYLLGKMTRQEKELFEKELSENENLRKELDAQQKIMKGIERAGIKAGIEKAFKTAKFKNQVIRWGIGIAIAVSLSGALFLLKKSATTPAGELKHEINELGNNNWSTADKQLPSQVFTINPKKDTVVETNGGILFSIPAGAFLNKYGETESREIEVEIKEALNAFDIMKAGLSTTSNGQLLETAGMFYLNARVKDENLDIDKSKSIYANVPADKKDNMQLFEGKRMPDGSINWINPSPIKKSLNTVDILSLDFYPNHYLDSLKKWGYDSKNKKFTDSLYYSFAGYCGFYEGDLYIADSTRANRKDSAYTQTKTLNGRNLFQINCAVCHSMSDKKITGSGLRGITERAPKGDWLLNYIKNNVKMIESGDAYANKIFREKRSGGMPIFEGTLTDNEINAIISYLSNGTNGFTFSNENSECPEINPSRIRAIWNRKFNNTLLATKEFEERLKVIFKTCNANVLNLYTNNLNKYLSDIDSVAATLSAGEERQKFIEFARRKDGGVEIDKLQVEQLQNYIREKKKMYDVAAQNAMKKVYEAEGLLNQVAVETYLKHQNKENTRIAKLFEEELEINLKEAYRQLGKPYNKIPKRPAKNYYTLDFKTSGWKNIDAYVNEATSQRSSLNYTDTETGKKATIQYLPANITVTNAKNYDRVLCYLLPEKLSSFQLMKTKGEMHTENLNELLSYSLVCVGFKGEEIAYKEINNLKPGDYNIELSKSNNLSITEKLNSRFSSGNKSDLFNEIQYQLFEQKETIRQKKIEDREAFKFKVMQVIFPCYNNYALK